LSDALSDAGAARRALERLLETDAPALRAILPPGFADAAERYVELLLHANVRLNLTRIVDPAEVARLHLLDALSALPLLDALAPGRALDLGTGGGVPGILLALARPAVSWTLVDSVAKKADAVRGFAEALGINNVTVLAHRAETLGRDARHRGQFDLVAARACASLPVLAEYALPLLRVGGALVAWKGPVQAGELRAGRAAAAGLGGGDPEVQPTRIAALGGHRFVVVAKIGATPTGFPRRPGEPARRPLG
jgi:16S rRNA (guanine527-N7)-methyltransferase